MVRPNVHLFVELCCLEHTLAMSVTCSGLGWSRGNTSKRTRPNSFSWSEGKCNAV
jgi:hypothetical protein